LNALEFDHSQYDIRTVTQSQFSVIEWDSLWQWVWL